ETKPLPKDCSLANPCTDVLVGHDRLDPIDLSAVSLDMVTVSIFFGTSVSEAANGMATVIVNSKPKGNKPPNGISPVLAAIVVRMTTLSSLDPCPSAVPGSSQPP